MNRRDFIFLKNSDKGKVLELSCESLYMQFLDIQTADRVYEDGADTTDPSSCLSSELPTQLTTHKVECFFGDLHAQLRNCSNLRLLDPGWIVAGDFGNKIEVLLRAYKASGGIVEIINRIDQTNGA